jgi:hypothetical protein
MYNSVSPTLGLAPTIPANAGGARANPPEARHLGLLPNLVRAIQHPYFGIARLALD